jgi:hypothetical protein
MMQRCFLYAVRKYGFSLSVSTLALMGFILILGFVHEGTSPQLRDAISLSLLFNRITVQSAEGVML